MNLANKITALRIFLIPVFMIAIYSNIEYGNYIAAAIFIIASLTDAIDGYIARSRNLVTTFGEFIDPLADKLLISAAFISLVEFNLVPGWIVIAIISREFTVTGFRIIAASQGLNLAASKLGKIKTVTQIIAITLTLINNLPFKEINISLSKIMLYLSLFFTILSGIDYIYKNIYVLKMGDK